MSLSPGFKSDFAFGVYDYVSLIICFRMKIDLLAFNNVLLELTNH